MQDGQSIAQSADEGPPPAPVAALAEDRRVLEQFGRTLAERYRQETLAWKKVGVSFYTYRRVLRGENLMPKTVRTIGAAAGLPADEVDHAARAAEAIRHDAISRGWQQRRSILPGQRRSANPPRLYIRDDARWIAEEIEAGWKTLSEFGRDMGIKNPWTFLRPIIGNRHYQGSRRLRRPFTKTLARLAAVLWAKRGERGVRAITADRSRRTIPLPVEVVDALRQLRKWKVEQKLRRGPRFREYGLVFCGPSGKPLHANNIRYRDHYPRLKRLKLPRIRPHDLRHGHASHLVAAGVDHRTVADRLGHSSPSFTLATYVHGVSEAQRRAAEVASTLLALSRPKEGAQ
jgi:integrase